MDFRHTEGDCCVTSCSWSWCHHLQYFNSNFLSGPAIWSHCQVNYSVWKTNEKVIWGGLYTVADIRKTCISAPSSQFNFPPVGVLILYIADPVSDKCCLHVQIWFECEHKQPDEVRRSGIPQSLLFINLSCWGFSSPHSEILLLHFKEDFSSAATLIQKQGFNYSLESIRSNLI